MSKKSSINCSRTRSKSSSNENLNNKKAKEVKSQGEEKKKMIKIGKPAPNFTAEAFYQGEFTEVSLEDYKGKWVLLCFYPGDFTFV